MLVKTHILISLLVFLFLFNSIDNQLVFFAVMMLSTTLPDIDCGSSYISNRLTSLVRLFTFFARHRGFFHSITAAILFSAILLPFSSLVSLAFFLGYSLHILSDSFTSAGITAFWPSKSIIRGRIATGGFSEKLLFIFLIAVNFIVALDIFL
ncbi:MAG: metal-dependent hydrolase [archaeon]